MIIWNIHTYRDGGTIAINIGDELQTICIDRRINTTTRNSIWEGYPGAGNLITDDAYLFELQQALIDRSKIEMLRINECLDAINDIITQGA